MKMFNEYDIKRTGHPSIDMVTRRLLKAPSDNYQYCISKGLSPFRELKKIPLAQLSSTGMTDFEVGQRR